LQIRLNLFEVVQRVLRVGRHQETGAFAPDFA
jgi:hypothetical protein